ncbi:MAG: archaeosortase/exosortase family protein, partial [Candidatus Binatia bacterium]
MEPTGQIDNSSIWRLSIPAWAAIFAVIALLIVIFDDGIRSLISVWNGSAEYGYGYMIPPIALFLIWQKKNQLQSFPFAGSWLGLVVVLLGLGLFFLGELSTLHVVIHYSIVVVLAGLILA